VYVSFHIDEPHFMYIDLFRHIDMPQSRVSRTGIYLHVDLPYFAFIGLF